MFSVDLGFPVLGATVLELELILVSIVKIKKM